MITNYLEFLQENLNSEILIIVDVQKEFEKWIPKGMVDNINEHCNKFGAVYQIWDSNDAEGPSYDFKNQTDTYEKKFGTTFSNELYNKCEEYLSKNPHIKEGGIIRIEGFDGDIVRVKNNHKWFYVNPRMLELYKILKGNTVTVVGGADNECLEDVFESMESYQINPVYNHDFIYSAKTSNKQQV